MTYPASAGMQTNERIGGLAAIFRAARMLENCPTDFADSIPAEDLLLWCEAAACSVWYVYPSQLTELQVMRWRDAQEQPDFVETTRGLVPACEWLVVRYKTADESRLGDEEADWVIHDEERVGSFWAAERMSDERSEGLAEGVMVVAGIDVSSGYTVEWDEEGFCEIYASNGRPRFRVTKEHG